MSGFEQGAGTRLKLRRILCLNSGCQYCPVEVKASCVPLVWSSGADSANSSVLLPPNRSPFVLTSTCFQPHNPVAVCRLMQVSSLRCMRCSSVGSRCAFAARGCAQAFHHSARAFEATDSNTSDAVRPAPKEPSRLRNSSGAQTVPISYVPAPRDRSPRKASKTPGESPLAKFPKSIFFKRDNRPSTISLLDELFPTENEKRQKTHPSTNRTRRHDGSQSGGEVPWMPLDKDIGSGATRQTAVEARRKVNRPVPAEETAALLLLRKASLHLCDADFQRVIPVGQHIEGWSSASYSKVIKSRDPNTLRPNGTYYITFHTVEAAQAYLANAERLHQFNKRYDPSPRDEPIPPPPVLSQDGKRAEEPMSRFTLCLPSEELSLHLIRAPFAPMVRRIIEESPLSWYGKDGSGEARSDHEVLLDFEGFQSPFYHPLREAIRRDGDLRKMQWDLSGSHGGIREMKPLHTQRRTTSKRYVLSFVDQAEAQCFCMEWHRRDISDLLFADGKAGTEQWTPEGPLIANAEYIW